MSTDVSSVLGFEEAMHEGHFLALDPTRAWIVDGGTMDVFVVVTAQGLPVGRWTPLATAAPGSVITGVPSSPRGHALLCRLAPGCRVREVSIEEVHRDARELDERRAELSERIDTWLAELLESIHYRLAPQEFTPLERGRMVQMPYGSVGRAVDGITWLTLHKGRARLLGRELSHSLRKGVPAVISPAEWIVVEDDATITTHSTADLVDDGTIWDALGTIHSEALTLTAVRIARVEEEEAERMLERERRDREVVAETTRMFRSILQGRAHDATLKIGVDPAVASMGRVFAVLGVELRTPPSSARSGPRVDAVDAIAVASRARVRTVRLLGQWWKRDFGPLIAYIKEGELPAALIRRRGGYDLYDPRTPEAPRRVNATIARELAIEGKTFYRPLAERPISGWELFRHGMRGGRRDVMALLTAGSGVAALGLLVPIMTGVILGTLVAEAQLRRIDELCILLLISAVVSAMLAMLYNIAGLRIEGRLDENVQAGIWDRVMSLPSPFIRKSSTGQLATAALAVSNVREQLSGLATKGLLAALVGIANLILILVYDVRLFLLAIAMVIFSVALSLFVGSRQLGRQRANFEQLKEINSRSFQLIGGVPKLRASASEDRAFAYWAQAFGAGRTQSVAIRGAQNRLTAFNAAYTVIGSIFAFILVGAVLHVSTSVFLGFNVAFFQVLGSVLVVSTTMMLGVTVAPLLEGVTPLISAQPETSEAKEDAGELSGAIEVSHLSFSYDADGPQILHDVSFKAGAGEFIGVVGPSGSGKSTLLRLLLGFEAPTSGAVLYDEQDLGNLDVVSVRRQCGVVLQNGTLFAGDILTNIVGSGLYSYEDAWEAVKACGMEDDIDQMPMGLHTVLSEGATTLSGGQRQRLLIARSIVARPRILFLDEATSALDNRSQETVTDSLHKLNATRIVIAHRLSTIRDADRIIVMDAGRIIESGTYDELMALEGMFSALARRQIA